MDEAVGMFVVADEERDIAGTFSLSKIQRGADRSSINGQRKAELDREPHLSKRLIRSRSPDDISVHEKESTVEGAFAE